MGKDFMSCPSEEGAKSEGTLGIREGEIRTQIIQSTLFLNSVDPDGFSQSVKQGIPNCELYPAL